jgi:hypothetical protein
MSLYVRKAKILNIDIEKILVLNFTEKRARRRAGIEALASNNKT